LVEEEVEVRYRARGEGPPAGLLAEEPAVELLQVEWVELFEGDLAEGWFCVAADKCFVAVGGGWADAGAGVLEPAVEVAADRELAEVQHDLDDGRSACRHEFGAHCCFNSFRGRQSRGFANGF
jgi:hypothetical protein